MTNGDLADTGNDWPTSYGVKGGEDEKMPQIERFLSCVFDGVICAAICYCCTVYGTTFSTWGLPSTNRMLFVRNGLSVALQAETR